MIRPVILISVVLSFSPVQGADFNSDILPTLQKYCVKCHGPETQESNLRLDTLAADFTSSPTAGAWIEVRDNINLGEMPPEGEPRPEGDELIAVSQWIQGELKAMQALTNSSGGRVPLRRLSRTEYLNTVRDLLKVTFVEGNSPRDILPPDGSIEGFDKLSKALLLDPSLMENYFAAAQLVADRAVRTKPPRVPRMKARFEVEDRASGGRSIVNTRTGMLVYEKNIRTGNEALRHPYASIVDPYGGGQFPESGRYAIRIRAGADRGNRPDEPLYLDVSWSQNQRKRFEIQAPIDRPAVYEWILDIDTNVNGEIQAIIVNGTQFNHHYGDTYVFHNAMGEAQRNNDNRTANIERARGRAQGFYDLHFKSAPSFHTRDLSVLPRIFVDWMELEGPLHEEFPPASTRHVFHKGFDDPSLWTSNYVREILTRLLPRAFRRPVSGVEIDTYAQLVEGELSLGNSFASAVKTGLIAVLCSPDFLYILEPDQGGVTDGPRELTEFELASRLSYFLWSSMPDDELFGLAKSGRLADDGVLNQQIERMLSDAKSEALVTDFARQWLKVDEFDKFLPDEQIYKQSYYSAQFGGIGPDMEVEAYAFFREVLRKNESVLNFLDSDWIMANGKLASYYGIEGVEGEHFRRVPLPANSPRGGILGMAGVHKWGSDGNRTKPVERGKYILSVLFNDPPDPPPPNAGEVEPNIEGERLTVRDRLLQHQKVQACAGCHRTIDPYGLAMENFNVVGLWRDVQDGEKEHMWGSNPPPIINEGTLPNGKSYNSFAEFKSLITSQTERFERGLAEKLMVYALGRTLEPTDDPVLQRVVAETGNSGHTLPSLIRSIVHTDAFRTK